MVEKVHLKTLEELISEYPIILMDTCAILHYIGENKDPHSPEEKMIVLEKQHQFITILTDYIGKGIPCFITSLVFEESQIKGHYPYKKIIKNKRTQHNRELLDRSRKIKNAEKEMNKLSITFKENDRIKVIDQTFIQPENLTKALYLTLYLQLFL